MTEEGPFKLGLLLAALAGWVDAAGVGLSSGIFLSFMSGNTTNLAVSLVHRNWSRAELIGSIVALFVVGVAAGELIAKQIKRDGRPLILAIEAVALGVGTAAHWPGTALPPIVALAPLVFAMGLQNAAMHRASGIGIGLTYVTGTLVQIGRALAGLHDWKSGIRYAALWLSLAVGAGAESLVLTISTLAALSLATVAAAALAIVSAAWSR